MGKENSHGRQNTPINFDNYALKEWLRNAGVRRRHELLQKLQKDLKELNLSKCDLHRAWIQLTTKPYVVLTQWTKATASAISDEDKCNNSLPFLEDCENNARDLKNEEDLSDLENIRKTFKCSNEENKKICADASEMMTKFPSHPENLHVSDGPNGMRKMKFEEMMGERKKYLMNKYKMKKETHESTNKELNTCYNASQIIPASNKLNRIQIPVQIDRKKLKMTLNVELSEKEVNNSKRFYYKSETMEADSTVSNDKKDDTYMLNNKNRNKPKDVSQHKLHWSVSKDKFQDNFNVPMLPNKNYHNIKERKRKRIKEKFRDCFGDCLTISEEEEEESILDSCTYKKQKNEFNETLNDSTTIGSHTVLDMSLSQAKAQDISTNIVTSRDTTNNTVSTETSNFKAKNIEQVEAVSSIINVIECNNNTQYENISDNDMFVSQNKSPVDKNLCMEEITQSIQLDSNEGIQTNSSNDKISNSFLESHSLNSENIEEKNVQENSTKSINIDSDVLPDSNINNDNCNDTNMETLTNNSNKISISSEENSSNNNCDETTCHLPTTSYIKEPQLNADSYDSSIASTIVNSTLNSASPISDILEISKTTENHSKTLQGSASVDTIKQTASAIVEDTSSTKSYAKNINIRSSIEIQNKVRLCTEISKCTLENSNMDQQNISDNILEANELSIKSISEDLKQILQMDINQNHTIQCDGNTISIQENHEKGTSQCVMVKNTCISNITNDGHEVSSKHFTSKIEETFVGKCSSTVTDTNLKEDVNTSNMQSKNDIVIPVLLDEKEKLSADDNTVNNISPIACNTLLQHPSLDCNIKNIENFKQPETNQPSKIRVLSSAELGSRWCPTPLSNSASNSTAESKLPSHTIVELINDNDPSKDSTKNTELNLNAIPNHIQLTLSYIYNIMMRIRTIKQKHLVNNCKDMTTGNEKIISDNEQFKSNLTVLLQEFINLGKELQIRDIDIVVQYAISMINKHYMPSQYEPITGYELSHYIEALAPKPSKLAATTTSNNVSAFNEQGTNLDKVYIATTKPVPTVSNNPNIVPVTISFIPNLYVPTVPQNHIGHNNLPKQNVYVSNVPNQNYEHVSNLQAMEKSNIPISYIPSMQSKYTNVHVIQENRASSINVPHHQRLIQQQPIPVVAMSNVPNPNIIQLKNDIHIAQRLNMQKPQEGLIRNKPDVLIGQYSIPQRLPQQAVPQIPQQKLAGSQIYVPQNSQNTHVSYSTTTPTHLPNALPRTPTISYDLIFKIWDQVTYCFEEKLINCRVHETHDKINCPLELFYKRWNRPLTKFMYHKMLSKNVEPPIKLQSQEALHRYHYILKYNKWRQEQLFLKNKELQNQSPLMNSLNKTARRNNLVSPVSVQSQNVTAQPEVIQYKPQQYKKNVNSEKQQQSQVQFNLQLLNNMVFSVHEVPSNASEKNNSLLTESDYIHFDNATVLSHKTDYVENPNATASTSLESKTKKKSMAKTDRAIFLEDDDIEILEMIHRKENIPLPKQTDKAVIHMQEESLLPKQITTEKIIHAQEENLLPEQTTEEVVHVQEESLLSTQIIREAVNMEKECSLPEETITEEVIHAKEQSSLIGQIIKDNTNYLQCRSIQSLTLSDPHIVDVRSISPTSFNKIETVFLLDETQLSSFENTGNNEIKVKIEIPEDKKPCLKCSKPSKFVCEVCIEAYYCSKECAESYWELEHHKHCKPSSLRLSEKCDNGAPTTEDSDFNVSYVNVP